MSSRGPFILLGIMTLLFFAIGCGKPPMQEVKGSVKLDNKAVENCKVGFFPDTEQFDSNRHGFGFGVTNAKGEFEIQHPQGDRGIWAGKYKVTFVAWIDKSGKSLSVDTKPSEVAGGVRNKFPDIYEAPSTTKESVVVKSGKNHFDFNISSK